MGSRSVRKLRRFIGRGKRVRGDFAGGGAGAEGGGGGFVHLAGEDDEFLVVLDGVRFGNGASRLAREGALVEAALAGEDEVGFLHALLEFQPGANEVKAGDKLGGAGHAEAEAQTAGCAGAGLHHGGLRLVEVRAQAFRHRADRLLEAR